MKKREENIETKARMLHEIIIGEISPSPLNPRLETQKNINSLAASIKTVGLLSPVLVRPIKDGHYEIIHGERRLLAVKSLGWKTITAEVKKLTDGEVRTVRLVENIQRKDLTAIEKGKYIHEEILRRMNEDGLRMESIDDSMTRNRYFRDLATDLNVTKSAIADWWKLFIDLPTEYRRVLAEPSQREAWKTGLIAPSVAQKIIRIGNKIASPKKTIELQIKNNFSSSAWDVVGVEVTRKTITNLDELLERLNDVEKNYIKTMFYIPKVLHSKVIALSKRMNKSMPNTYLWLIEKGTELCELPSSPAET